MITVHRLGHVDDVPMHLNSDLIVTIEKTPDTVVTLATGHKVVVAETPEEVLSEVFRWRVAVASGALQDGSPAGHIPNGSGDATVRPLRGSRLKV